MSDENSRRLNDHEVFWTNSLRRPTSYRDISRVLSLEDPSAAQKKLSGRDPISATEASRLHYMLGEPARLGSLKYLESPGFFLDCDELSRRDLAVVSLERGYAKLANAVRDSDGPVRDAILQDIGVIVSKYGGEKDD